MTPPNDLPGGFFCSRALVCMKVTMRVLGVLLLVLARAGADITVINDLINPQEIYELVFTSDSDVWWQSVNTTKYYCIWRNLWTEERHPNDYPKAARWSDIVLFSGTKELRPFLKNRATTIGVETIAEKGFVDVFHQEFKQSGEIASSFVQGDGFFIDNDHPETNYVFIPPAQVSFDYPFLNGIAGISPSPDWFSIFYLFDTVDEYDRTFWGRFTLRLFPWDAGTDAGVSYTDEDRDLVQPENVTRIYANNTPPNKAFLSPDGKDVWPVAELDCELYTCPVEDPKCVKPNFPPPNYCDVLMYPDCYNYCDPKTAENCQPCYGNGYEPKLVYFTDCCVAGHEPRQGESCADRSYRSGKSGGSMLSTMLGKGLSWIALLVMH